MLFLVCTSVHKRLPKFWFSEYLHPPVQLLRVSLGCSFLASLALQSQHKIGEEAGIRHDLSILQQTSIWPEKNHRIYPDRRHVFLSPHPVF